MKIFRFLLLLACSRSTRGDLIAKSSITICENTGGGDDPMSVVYEKACEKKLIVTMTVRSGQVRDASFFSVSTLSVSLMEQMKTTLVEIRFHKRVTTSKLICM